MCSKPELLEDIRREVYENAAHIDSETKSAVIDLSDIREHCPFIVAVFQENLRLRMSGRATAVVYEDVVLDNKYLLKVGCMVQIPYSVIMSTPRSGALLQGF